ncbi:Eco57I restriction-modification methylase domain-containing protein [Hymenobacter weizhouensis]|uniref:Eco57I restriction-modification methylase domain-containing protein n=1 Tax=Hymenobacter sp. YIM 151500-1 TaxID=2987689 RepID=UPI002227A817|nr:N-6 DNA methylase [Hymenobacter sp. YIM 151500-1]UYZ63947.1 N-6 DNA methylase [Hymenobacter sp. YIM 151500-1]
MPTLLPLFPAQTLPAPLTHFDPATALPDFAERVRHLRRWQQAIKEGYVRSRKEEALQAEFLNLLFGQVLGYEYEATTHRQLQLELKTLTDGTKPDGALGEFVAGPGGGLGGPVRAVVELKDARTLLDAKQRGGAGKGRQETPVEQAFSYPSKFGGQCRWVLVSNFVELRLYSAQDQTRAEVFNLETLPDQPEQLRRLLALLRPQHLLPAPGRAEAPLDEALQQRQQEELKITKAFYKDYSTARRQLLDHLIEQNPLVPPLELLQHTQKLLDRVIFVCFCEDKNIIPRLTFRRLLDAVRQNVFDPADDKVYRTVRGLFQSIDQGNALAGINRFNGGLFAQDAALDALVIKDRTLTPVIQLEQYDFASDLNVNILGHIFEQSLSDLEAERARLSGLAHDPRQGKRKQDGIFYTPEYITRYIVRQAVGGWLHERRRQAGLDQLPELTDEDRATIRLGAGNKLVQPSRAVQKHIAAWEQYAQALEGIRVLDPACGSGAFLNEAFGYLLREGQHVNQELAALRAGQFKVFDLDRHILQHNLYGVDLNPESVDITRLSLWLQTANPGKPLTSLDHSIRCGNSLISDPAVAGPRAFDWQATFPEVFEQGGFDVVIGNPPYGAKLSKVDKDYLANSYPNSGTDTYIMFWELSVKLVKQGGLTGFIVPNTFLVTENNEKIRKLLFEETSIAEILEPFGVFSDAVVETVVMIIQNTKPTNSSLFRTVITDRGKDDFSIKLGRATVLEFKNEELFNREKLLFNYRETSTEKTLSSKLKRQFFTLKQFAKITAGVKPYEVGKGNPPQTSSTIEEKPYTSFSKHDSSWEPVIRGTDVTRYSLEWSGEYIKYGPNLAAPRSPQSFFTDKVFIRRTDDKILATYDAKGFVGINSVHCLQLLPDSGLSLLYILSLLNSKIIDWIFSNDNFHMVGKPLAEVKVVFIERLPIPNISLAEQQPFITAAEALLAGHKALHEAEAAAGRLVRAELGLTAPLTGKLALGQPWKTWSAALEKALGRKLTLPEKGEWLPYLTEFQEQQQERRAALHRQDAALDQLVYQLYQLTPEEIALVEGRPAPASA